MIQNLFDLGHFSFNRIKTQTAFLTSDASISINISTRSLCASEDSRTVGQPRYIKHNHKFSSYAYVQMFSEDIVDISISAR